MSTTLSIKSLRIGSYDWTVKYIDDLKDSDGDLIFGETDSEVRTIRINSSYTPETQRQTLYHEATHAALFESGISHILASSDLEEGIVRALENLLWPSLKTLITQP